MPGCSGQRVGKGPRCPGQPLTCCVTAKQGIPRLPEFQFPITKTYHSSCLFWGILGLKSPKEPRNLSPTHPPGLPPPPTPHTPITQSDSQADFFSEPWLARR